MLESALTKVHEAMGLLKGADMLADVQEQLDASANAIEDVISDDY